MSNKKTERYRCLFDRELLNSILENELMTTQTEYGKFTPEVNDISDLKRSLNNLFDHYNQLTGV